MQSALKLTNVSKTYKDFKLKDINIDLPKGCIMGFIGENGAGKTTTIKIILDLIKRDSGNVSVLGKDNLTELDTIKENIGVVFDECFFPEILTVHDINKIMEKTYKTWDNSKYQNYIKEFDLPINKSISEFSKGMKMKLSLTVAMSHDSKLLILDEATSGLDPIIKDEILDIFLQFIQDEEHSIFISSHIISDLEKVCDYITLIHKGKIIFSEEKDVLLEKYGVLKCSNEELEKIDKKYIIGARHNKFGAEALVLRDKIDKVGIIEKASIEDIMLYNVKEMA